jgi:hypothetical protein
MRLQSSYSAFWLTLGLFMASSIRAEQLPRYSITELTIGSPIVVVGDFIDPKPGQIPTKIKVTEGIRGRGMYQIGDEIEFSLSEYTYRIGQRYVRTDRPGIWDRAENKDVFLRGLLFLDVPGRSADPHPVVLSGLRLETTAGALYFPRQKGNPGPYILESPSSFVMANEILEQRHRESGSLEAWEPPHRHNPLSLYDEILEARQAMKIVEEADLLLATPDPQDRVAAILAWIESQESKQDATDAKTSLWIGCLPRFLSDFRQHATCEQMWQFRMTYGRLDHHRMMDLPLCKFVPTEREFFSVAARTMLRTIAQDTSSDNDERIAALSALGDTSTVWGRQLATDKQMPSVEEQQTTIDELVTFLQDNDREMRRAAVYAILIWSFPTHELLKKRIELRAAPALVAYFSEKPRENVLWDHERYIVKIIGVDEWQKLKDRK